MKKKTVCMLLTGLLLLMTACGENENGRGTYDRKKDDPAEEKITDEIKNTDDIRVEEEYEWGDFVFSTTDINGDKVTEEIMKDSRLVLLNLWEPWCGPCVNEMPDLQKLYEKYKDDGLLIIGAYATLDMSAEAKELVDSIGITYPIIKADDNIIGYEQDYVPATFLFDGRGNLLESGPVEGSRSYEAWEDIILRYIS